MKEVLKTLLIGLSAVACVAIVGLVIICSIWLVRCPV